MAAIAIQIDPTADPATAWTALATTQGVAGWWTTRNQTSGVVGEVDRMWFPDAPMAWALRVDVIWWETLEQAQAASERSMTSESCSPMFALINMDSALMLHGTPAINPVNATTPARA